jgi:hypothetical protein
MLPAGTIVKETVRIGVNAKPDGSIRGLITEHEDLIGMLVLIYEKYKNPEITNSLSKFFDLLKDGSFDIPRHGRRSGSYKNTFAKLIEDLMQIVFSCTSSYKLPNGNFYESEKTFKVLSKRELFHRKEGSQYKYCDISRLTLDPTFIQAIEKSKFKVKRLDQMVKIEKPGAKKLYSYLDWVLWNRWEHTRNAFELAKELEIVRKRKDSVITDLRKYCNEIKGLQFTHGMISEIGLKQASSPSDWNLFVKKIPLQKIIKINTKEKKEDLFPLTKTKEDIERDEIDLMEYYNSLNKEEKTLCELYEEEEINKIPEKYRSEFGKKRCRFLAIERHKKEEAGARLFLTQIERRKNGIAKSKTPIAGNCISSGVLKDIEDKSTYYSNQEWQFRLTALLSLQISLIVLAEKLPKN